ncbi:Abi family protein [Yersinia ruckeri]|uniref:Abi family protein n=1 Tax=Yersinia ruckeri TaxID=29486 RepID=UPI000F8CBA1D|nr:Abi family protein [Yersinia ruckeri]MCK8540590.1 Abi family protein [Yersinia ruckeri]MCK8572647.1 Abi family protein [Yersinia ruckeri]MCK8576090.1 Abi family protein [Yersinia ruckeri]MCK8578915.1 Abi family protein [Yersinia ruckeri]MCK8582636.1 Abi family protein [Yersinia ruckeri]
MTITAITQSLSTPRFATYQLPILGGTSPEQCLGMYLWNKQLASAFLPVLQIVEISLRNAIHQSYVAAQEAEIEKSFPQPTWAARKEAAKSWFINVFTPINNREANRNIEAAKRQLTIDRKLHTPENIIAKLTFGFWVSLVKNDYDTRRATYLTLWPDLRAEVFPNAVDTNTRNPLSINSIGNELKEINKIRNRLSHHEPLWRNNSAYQVEEIINKVIEHYDRCLKVINWINPSNLKLLELIDNNRKMAGLCNLHALWKNKQLPAGLATLPMNLAWADSVKLDTAHTGEVVAVISATAIMIKSEKDKVVFHCIQADVDGDMTAYTMGARVHFYPQISAARYPNAKNVTRL